MGTATQLFWYGSSGALLIPRGSETTARTLPPAMFVTVQNTGGNYSAPLAAVDSTEDREWAALLATERKSAKRRRIGPKAITRAINEVRYVK